MILAKTWRKALTTFSTSTGFTAPAGSTTRNAAAIDLLDSTLGFKGGKAPDYLNLLPICKDGSNDTFDFRLYGLAIDNDSIYVPELLIDVSVVIGAQTLSTGVYLADTITINDGAADNGPWSSKIDAQEDLVATILVHTRGNRWVYFDWDLAGGQEAVSMNCLYRPIYVENY